MIKLLIILAVLGIALYAILPARMFTPGRAMSRRIVDDFVLQNGGESNDPAARALVESVADRLTAPVRADLEEIQFQVIRSGVPNAFAVGTRHVCVTEGLIELHRRREDLVAAVVAHELGHILSGHSARRFKDRIFLTGASMLAGFVLRSPWITSTTGIFRNLALARFSQTQEFEADACALWLMHWAGYDPRGLARSLREVEVWYGNRQGAMSGPLDRYFSSHPPIERRISQLEGVEAEIDASKT